MFSRAVHLANINIMTHVVHDSRRPPFSNAISLILDEAEKALQSTRIPGTSIPIDGSGANVHKYLHQELSVAGLNIIHDYLWMAGRVDGLRPLHCQKMIKRDIVVAEDPGLHLLCLSGCLLDYNFFITHICPNDTLFTTACGFLRSYSLLIQHESDFRIAQNLGLLPQYMTWGQWSEFAYRISNIPLSNVTERFRYGELRLSRVNLIYNVCRCRPWYYKIHRDYQSWFSYELGFMLVVVAYASVVMSALQVMLTMSSISLEVAALCYWASVTTALVIVAVFAWQFVGIVCIYFFSCCRALR
ncbi:hypothetical protein EDC04DRAFT_3006703 [Pisolithus marmoratus]|nr:hypothetical protein EDC04DRAFT_3006703 [Pisolithus marmoratus]